MSKKIKIIYKWFVISPDNTIITPTVQRYCAILEKYLFLDAQGYGYENEAEAYADLLQFCDGTYGSYGDYVLVKSIRVVDDNE